MDQASISPLLKCASTDHQEAFRSLLSRPREGGPSRSKAVLGKAPPKRGWDIKPKPGTKKQLKKDADDDGEEGDRPAFAPRSQARKVHEEAKYKDRAALRRGGGDGEYKEVEHLLEEFERRKEEAGADADKVEAQRSYLGGDAEHSVLVKGLDYALLARRKAEIEAERAAGMDDELDQLGEGLIKPKGNEKAEAPREQKSNKFKSIGKQDAPVEKKMKKRRKVEREEVTDKAPRIVQARAPSPVEPVPPPEPEDEDDIFADAGEYDLKAGREEDDEDDDDESEDGRMDVDAPRGRSRSRSRSADMRQRSYSREESRDRDMRSRSRSFSRPRDNATRYNATRYQNQNRYRSPSRERSYSRSRSRSRGYRSGDRERYDYDDRRRGEQRSYNNDYDGDRRRRDRSWDRDGGHQDRRFERDDRRDHSRRYDYEDDHRDRKDGDRDYGRHSGRSGSGTERWRDERRGGARGARTESRSRSRSPMYRERGGDFARPGQGRGRSISFEEPSGSRSRSPPPRPQRRPRSRSRSPTPLLQQTLPFERSPTPESDDDGPVTRLQPLASSAITDLRGFLAADEAGAKADARRLNKARWRAAQGLSLQEGVDTDALQRGPNEKQKANREYQVLMNRIGKDKDQDKGGGGGGDKGPSGQ